MAFIHRHPPNRLLHPLVQPELTENILFAGCLFGRCTGCFHFVDSHGNPKRRVGLLPHFRVGPVILLRGPVDDRVKRGVMLPPFQDVHGLLMDFIADAVGIRPGCGNEKIQGLHPGIPGAFGHYIKKLSVGLGMEFIEHHPVDIKPVLGIGLTMEACCRSAAQP